MSRMMGLTLPSGPSKGPRGPIFSTEHSPIPGKEKPGALGETVFGLQWLRGREK